MKLISTIIFTATLLLAQPVIAITAVDSLLDEYRATGAGPFNAESGDRMWSETFRNNDAPIERSCQSCHTSDLTAAGKHTTTRKLIKPLAPGANAERLTDTANIEKWFMRNCKWTFNRECTAQEKGDFLLFIQNWQQE